MSVKRGISWMLKEDIAGNTERVELYFAASYVENDHEFSAFLAVLGADYYGVLRNLLAPERPKDEFFDESKRALIA